MDGRPPGSGPGRALPVAPTAIVSCRRWDEPAALAVLADGEAKDAGEERGDQGHDPGPLIGSQQVEKHAAHLRADGGAKGVTGRKHAHGEAHDLQAEMTGR